jgi:alkanesulfonate monooxygenase SsuD/methylene tetrahydromethanopterin reductase-like flavin-dependent oxidoreductase (luciferase family)
MHWGAFFYGTVDMPDAGVGGPPAHQRRYSQADYQRVYADLLAYAQHCDALGYDSMWTAEHHFHQHGFEVVRGCTVNCVTGYLQAEQTLGG